MVVRTVLTALAVATTMTAAPVFPDRVNAMAAVCDVYFVKDVDDTANSGKAKPFTDNDMRQLLVDTAETYIGRLEYALIGGESDIDGIRQADCSGFVWQIYKKCGALDSYKGYRTCQETMERAMDGKCPYIYEISMDEILPGDIIVYENTEDYILENPEKVYGHMGLYIGNDEIIHTTRGEGSHNGCIRSRIGYRDTPAHAVRIDLAAAVKAHQ